MDTPNPIEAVTHENPNACHAQWLQAHGPVHRDARLALWVVMGEDAVRAALAHPALRVRPPAEPVPAALVGRPTGEVFAQLVRMTDGTFHREQRPRVDAASSRLSLDAIAEAASVAARELLGRCDADAWLGAVPVRAMAIALGVPAPALDATTDRVLAFVRAIAPGASADAIAEADEACAALMAEGEALRLDRAASANRIALMQQASDATAGLAGLSVLRFVARGAPGPSLGEWVDAVAQVALDDPPVHTTRRFAAEPLELGGRRIAAGEGLLVVLASARGMGFGAGPHACPGERIAITIAASALRSAHEAGAMHRLFARRTGWRPLANARVPTFA